MDYRLGVDLGTTYTAAAVYADGRAEMLGLGNRAMQVPSVLFVKDDGDVLVGESADRSAAAEPARAVREFKRRIGHPVPMIVGGALFSPQSMTAKLLAWVVGIATERQGGPPGHVCVTYPANWGLFKVDLLSQAVQLAGLNDASACTEPEAAAIAYASRDRLADGAKVAVYDLGGGTFDAAVLERTGPGFRLAGPPEGVEHLGGIDFDTAVVQYVLDALGPAAKDLDEKDPATARGLARLRRDSVEAKEELSSSIQASVPVSLPGIETVVQITRGQFEAMVRPAIRDTIAVMRRVLESASVTPEDLAAIVMVGGSSRIPLVSQELTAAFGRPLALDIHPKHDIALGAAIRGTPLVLTTGSYAPVEPEAPMGPEIVDVQPQQVFEDTRTGAGADLPIPTAPDGDDPTGPQPDLPAAAAASEPDLPTEVVAGGQGERTNVVAGGQSERQTEVVPGGQSERLTEVVAGGQSDRPTVWTGGPASERPTVWTGDAPSERPTIWTDDAPSQHPTDAMHGGPSGRSPVGTGAPPYPRTDDVGPPVRPAPPEPAPGRSASTRLALVVALATVVVLAGAGTVVALTGGIFGGTGGQSATAAPTPGPTTEPTAGPTTTPPAVSDLPKAPTPLGDDVLVWPRLIGGTNWEITVIRVAGGAPVSIVAGPDEDNFPVISTDRRTVVYQHRTGQQNSELRAVATDGSGDRPLFETVPEGCGNVFRPAYNDAKGLIALPCYDLASKTTNLLLTDLDGKVIRQLDQGSLGDPAMTADGAFVVYWRNNVPGQDGGEIVRLPTDGSSGPVPLTTGKVFDNDAAVEPDGPRVAFTRPGQGVFTVDTAQGNKVTQITNTPGDQDPIFSPDGSQIAFKRNNTEIWIVDAAGGTPRRITAPGDVGTAPAWSPR